jgi:peroxiredoxin
MAQARAAPEKPIAMSKKSVSIRDVQNFLDLPDNLPIPMDDGKCGHLPGLLVPSLPLLATDGNRLDLSSLSGRTVVYCYPKTGRPGQPLPDGWDSIPGARGCTTQACSFRDHYQELRQAGANQIFGLSTQDTEYQREAMERLHLPFSLLSDSALAFATALNLPTFEFEGETLLKRFTLVIDNGRISKVFYPVFPPNKSGEETLRWLLENQRV